MRKVTIVIDASMIVFLIVFAASQYINGNVFIGFINFLLGALWTCSLIKDWGRLKNNG